MRQSLCPSLNNSVQIQPTREAVDLRRKRRIEAFPAPSRGAVAKLARLSPALEDLADSFPALLFALATGYGEASARRAALSAVIEGLPLREAANRLGLPFWLRKLPAAAFAAPLGAAPTEPQLVNRLISLIPTTPAAAAAWLERVLAAHRTGNAELTLWVAQQYRGAFPAPRSASFLNVLAWAWFAGAGRALRAGQLLTTRWSPAIGARRASSDARLWRERIALLVCLGNGLDDTWLADGKVGDLEFVALRTADDFIAEAQAMDNCLDRYADRILGRAARVFSIRREGRNIACVEIAVHEREPGHPVIAQLRGPHNRRAPLEIWQAAYAWLGAQPLRLSDKHLVVKVGPALRERRQLEIWQPLIASLPEHMRDPATAALIGKPARRKARRPVASASVPLPPPS